MSKGKPHSGLVRDLAKKVRMRSPTFFTYFTLDFMNSGGEGGGESVNIVMLVIMLIMYGLRVRTVSVNTSSR